MLTREERRRFDEIARRIDQDTTGTAPGPETTTAIPVPLTLLGLAVIGATGVLACLATDDLVVIVLAVVGVVTTVISATLFAFAGTPGPVPTATAPPVDRTLRPGVSLVMRLW